MSLDKQLDKRNGISNDDLMWKLLKEYCAGSTDYRKLAEKYDISKSQVGILVNRALDELAERRKEMGMKIVDAELERLDKLLAYWEPRVKELKPGMDNKDISPRDTVASEMILKIMARRAKYLGLDAPAKVDLGADSSLIDLINQSIHGKEEKETEKT